VLIGSSVSIQVYTLEEGGGTALGPALAAAVGMTLGSPFSKVFLCTDGLATVGTPHSSSSCTFHIPLHILAFLELPTPVLTSLNPKKKTGIGKLDGVQTPEQERRAADVYRAIGQLAKDNGTVIDVISIRGDDCSLENIGALAELTSGTVDIVDPLEFGAHNSQIATLLAKPIVATNVTCKLILHKNLRFLPLAPLTVPSSSSSSSSSSTSTSSSSSPAAIGDGDEGHVVVRDVGNVTEDSDITFSFRAADFFDLPDGQQLPFQAQVSTQSQPLLLEFFI
jgi:hypothetical protein